MKLNHKISKIKKLKSKRKLVCLTAYSKPFAKILDKFCDIILVGDSVATAFYGMRTTKEISLETMITHSISVKKSVSNSVMVVDMPFNTYRNNQEAKKNVRKVFKKTNCDAVKLESNGKNFNIIKNLVKSRFPIMGHIGYTPQYKNRFQPQGVKKRDQDNLIREAIKIEQAGAFAIVLECVKAKTAKKISNLISIPTIGIGSSNSCDGQILVVDDLIGLSGFYPKFVKKYVNLQKILNKAFSRYKSDVIKKKFPNKFNTY